MLLRFLQWLQFTIKGRRNLIGLVILMLVVLIPPLLTFRQVGFIAWGDMDLPELSASRSIERAFFVWQGSSALGNFMPLSWPDIIPHYLLAWMLTEVLSFSPHIAQAIMYTLCFELAGLSAFFLVRTILPQQRYYMAALFSGLLYVFNLSFLHITWIGIYRFVFSYAILPLFLAIYARGLQSGDRKYLAFWAVALFMATGGLWPLPVGLAFAAVLVAYTVFASCIYGRRVWRISIEYAGVSVLAISMWLLPLMSFTLSGGGNTFEASSIRSSGTDFVVTAQHSYNILINTFRSFDFSWFYNQEGYSQGKPEALYPFADSYNTMSMLIIGSFLLPVLAFGSVLFKRHRDSQAILFFFSLTIGCLLLIKAEAPPLQQIFLLFNQIPFFSGLFREPYNKLQVFLSLGYAVLAGYTLNMLRIKIEGVR